MNKLWIVLMALLTLYTGQCFAAPAKVPTVPRFAKFEAAFTLPGQTGNPFDPADNAIDATISGPGGLTAQVPAFWDGDRWRVRFAPTRTGSYTLKLTRNGQPVTPADLTADRFQCVKSQEPGYVRRDPKVIQKFVFDGGQPYYPLGMDVAWQNGGGPDYPQMFASMGAAHMNWARVWMNNWDGKNLEWTASSTDNPPIGQYSLNAARRWDMILDEAAKDGIYVQLTLQHHGQYTAHTDPNWQSNPFNAANGGFLKSPDDFFTDARARQLTRAKYRYIVARWGYSTHLLAYELFNEVQNITEVRDHFDSVVNWHKEMAAYIRGLDTNHHLVTTSNSVPGEPLALIGMDYDQIHTYPPNIVSVFSTFKTASVPVPTFYGEWGTSGRTTPQELHDGLWASLASPAAGAGQFWYWDQVISDNLWSHFASATGFVDTLDVAKLGGMTRLEPTVASPGPRGSLTFSGPRAALTFAPPGDWGKTMAFDVIVSPDGRTPDLSGITPYIQGTANRALMAHPIVFHLNAPTACQFQVRLGRGSASGSHPVLALDGKTATELDIPPAANGAPGATPTLTVDVPAGVHTVSLFNTGPDWFLARSITLTNYAPSVGVVARGDSHHAVFWAYARDRATTAPVDAIVTVPGLAPGRYTARLWSPTTGNLLGSQSVQATKDGIALTLNGIQGDIAGVVTPSGERPTVTLR